VLLNVARGSVLLLLPAACCCLMMMMMMMMMMLAARAQVNQTFTIEPMIVEGSIKTKMWADKWTAVSEDGGLAAQYEHTLLITLNGVEVLTVA
jgi:hypothetical protein